jgi:hypothetical protein
VRVLKRGEWVIEFNVDERYPNRWREEPYYSQIKALSAIGLAQPEDEKFSVRVVVGDKIFFVPPRKGWTRL